MGDVNHHKTIEGGRGKRKGKKDEQNKGGNHFASNVLLVPLCYVLTKLTYIPSKVPALYLGPPESCPGVICMLDEYVGSVTRPTLVIVT